MKEETIFEKYEKVSNTELLSEYNGCVRATEQCLRIHSVDAHGHYHHQRELEEIIKSRMHSPDVIKLKVK